MKLFRLDSDEEDPLLRLWRSRVDRTNTDGSSNRLAASEVPPTDSAGSVKKKFL